MSDDPIDPVALLLAPPEPHPFSDDGAESMRAGLERKLAGVIVPGSVHVDIPEGAREARSYGGIEFRAQLTLPTAPCEDCDGTGWAAESNPGTGGGTGRDEQIAVPCPRGCPEPPDDDAADMELLGLAMDDAQEAMPADAFPAHVRYRLQALTEQGMVKQVAGGYAVTYLGAFHHEALASANRVWDEMATAAQGVDDEQGEDPRW